MNFFCNNLNSSNYIDIEINNKLFCKVVLKANIISRISRVFSFFLCLYHKCGDDSKTLYLLNLLVRFKQQYKPLSGGYPVWN